MRDSADERWMRLAIELAWQCPPSPTAYSVGAVIVDAGGDEISRGFSREGDPMVHAEESALGKLAADDPRLAGATIYSTLEPCSQRRSRPRTCTELIVEAGLRRVVIAWREPTLFVADCQGYELLAEAGLEVAELPSLAALAAAPNGHLAHRDPPGARLATSRRCVTRYSYRWVNYA
jgi:diaminohydroxyphosphoribosylaminopyrimidine deaminase/5-amino-6-(5-phosphoribosylamino)uracil reductase